MRRKPGTLLPIEVSILAAALDLRRRGSDEFHGYLIAREIKDREEAKLLTGHGTLYKALDRMRAGGLLESHWEDPEAAAAAERPRRRLYTITAAGERALEGALAAERAAAPATLREGLQPS